LRVLFFGSGSPASVRALQAIVPVTSVCALVVPKRHRLWHRDPAAALVDTARAHSLPVLRFDAANQQRFLDALQRRRIAPDLICIATFPSILRRDVLQSAREGGINLHASLLPKHRGADPLFWTYVNDDRVTGVTVHWLDERVDAGDIILQRQIPLARGRPVLDLYDELASTGASLLREAVERLERGERPRFPQDESRATWEPPRQRATLPDMRDWPAERVWHIARAGLGLLHDGRGAPLHGSVRGYAVTPHARPPGSIEETSNGWRVFCVDGTVELERLPVPGLWDRLRRRISRPRRSRR